jgi:hypothetical protein
LVSFIGRAAESLGDPWDVKVELISENHSIINAEERWSKLIVSVFKCFGT